MSTENFSELEKLFRKLEGYIGQRICLISGPCDGAQIAAYEPTGKLIASSISFDIKTAAEKLKEQLNSRN